MNIDFEQGDPITVAARLIAFIITARIPYPVLTAGNDGPIPRRFPQGVNLNCWPTSFFIGDAGMAGEGNS